MFINSASLGALAGKLAVESTSLPLLAKESIKSGFDLIADISKQAQLKPQNDFTTMGLSLRAVQTIKAAAKEFDLDRITVYPCIVNGLWTPCLRIDGNNFASFCRHVGIIPLNGSNTSLSLSEQNELFEQYGVIIYLRSDEK